VWADFAYAEPVFTQAKLASILLTSTAKTSCGRSLKIGLSPDMIDAFPLAATTKESMGRYESLGLVQTSLSRVWGQCDRGWKLASPLLWRRSAEQGPPS
jgi:hypothetical protein